MFEWDPLRSAVVLIWIVLLNSYFLEVFCHIGDVMVCTCCWEHGMHDSSTSRLDSEAGRCNAVLGALGAP